MYYINNINRCLHSRASIVDWWVSEGRQAAMSYDHQSDANWWMELLNLIKVFRQRNERVAYRRDRQAVATGTADTNELRRVADLAVEHHYIKTFMTDPSRRRSTQQILSEDHAQVPAGAAASCIDCGAPRR